MAEATPRQRRIVPASRAVTARPKRNVTACETALRTIARDCLKALELEAGAAGDGDADALHRTRIALTRLRAAIRFFAPAIDGTSWRVLREHGSWLSRATGSARDIDVALQRQRSKATLPPTAKQWRKQREKLQGSLRRAFRSARYKRFVRALARQCRPVDDGRDHSVVLRRFSTRRLKRWQDKLLTKAGKLDRLGPGKQHRLRIRTKRFRYALEWSLPVLKREAAVVRKQIAQAKVIQKALGKLNDANTHRAQAKQLGIDPLPSVMRLGRQKSQQRLISTARLAFGELRQLRLL